MSTAGVEHEKCLALKEVYNIVLMYGLEIKLYLRVEPNVNRDDYNSIKKKQIASDYTYTFKSYPFDFNPTSQQMEKAGITENVEAIASIPTKYFLDNNLEFDDIDLTRSTVEVKGHTYKIKQKNRVDQFMDEYLYITLGLDQV